jgi:myo-inositol-1(or 4)-monophosphatase
MKKEKALSQQKLNAKLKKTTIAAALAAGKVLTTHFRKKLNVSEKKGAGLVTNADVGAEKAALRVLMKAFPDFGILAEESAPVAKGEKKRGRWILDPLDGTTNFVHGFPMFCVSIAAEWDGEVVVGVIYHPILKDIYVAVKGKGAFLNGKRIRVSKTAALRDSLLTTGFTYRKDDWLKQEMQAFEALSRTARAIRRPGSAALDLAYVACGIFDGFWEQRLSPWDVAAGSLLVKEAGGKVTDFNGNPFRVDAGQIIASNNRLYASLQQTIAPQFCPI